MSHSGEVGYGAAMKLRLGTAFPATAAVLLAGLLAMGASAVHADSDDEIGSMLFPGQGLDGLLPAQSDDLVPLKQVVKRIRREFDGRVLDAQRYDDGGGPVYQVRVLTKDGQVLDIVVDALTGQILGVQGGD